MCCDCIVGRRVKIYHDERLMGVRSTLDGWYWTAVEEITVVVDAMQHNVYVCYTVLGLWVHPNKLQSCVLTRHC